MTPPDTTDARHAARIVDVLVHHLEAVHGTVDQDVIEAIRGMDDYAWLFAASLAEIPGVPTWAVRANVIVLLRKRADNAPEPVPGLRVVRP